MKRASQIHNGARGELIAYLGSWGVSCQESESEFELRWAAHENFRFRGPGAGPILPPELWGPAEVQTELVPTAGKKISYG